MDRSSLHGLYTATTTPLLGNGDLNVDAIATHTDFLIEAGIHGLVPVGGTGEATALSFGERGAVVSATVKAARGRVPVIAGVTAPGLADALALGRDFLASGADALMVLTPYAVAPTQVGIRDYYKALADGFGQSVMLYDIPYLTMVTIEPATVEAIAADGSIFAMKVSNPDQDTFGDLMRAIGTEIAVMAGDETHFVSEIGRGAVGGILASCNVLPRTWLSLYGKAKAGDLQAAQDDLDRLTAYLDAVYAEPNPGPLKAAQKIAGFDAGPVRAPLRLPGDDLTRRLVATGRELLAHEKTLGGRT